MSRLTDSEWRVLTALWDSGDAALSREEGRTEDRPSFLSRVYQGSAGDLVAAFLKEVPISPQERERLKKLLDEMEV